MKKLYIIRIYADGLDPFVAAPSDEDEPRMK